MKPLITSLNTRTSTPPRAERDKRFVVSLMEPTIALLRTANQFVVSTASESIFFMDDERHYHTVSLPTVNHDSTTTEIPRYDREDEQLLVFNRTNNGSLSPLPQQRYVRTCDISHDDGMTMANPPDWRTGTKLICHHCCTPGHIPPECNSPMNKIQDVVNNY